MRWWERDGRVIGQIGRIHFEAELLPGRVSTGLNPRTLYKGGGRLVRLRIDEAGRGIALYQRGWRYGRRKHLAIIRRVVDLLDGRQALDARREAARQRRLPQELARPSVLAGLFQLHVVTVGGGGVDRCRVAFR